jgi:hypothetical protein
MAAGGVTVPNMLKALALYPTGDPETYKDDYFYASASGERLCVRGGRYDSDVGAGVFYATFSSNRAASTSFPGFRAAYVALSDGGGQQAAEPWMRGPQPIESILVGPGGTYSDFAGN